ncbi:MAG: TetR family transcriptional regulator [Massilia sp.]|nr:TetR family transcriptional regulator [Massilia sp.]
MTQLRSDAALRRDHILDAADAVFSESGITAPLDLVVTRAGVGRATLYRNFPDRAALVEALFERALTGLEAAAPGQDLFALVEQVGLRIVAAPAIADYWRALEPGDLGAKAARERLARLFRAPLAAAVARKACRRDLRPGDLVLVCGMLGAALRGGTPANRRALVRRAIALLQDGVAAGPRGR